MKQKKSLLLVLGLATFGLCAVMTGGVAVSSISDFSGQRNIQLVGGLNSDVWLAPKSSEFGIPFLFYFYGGREPFDLRLQIWDESKQYRGIKITEVILEYPDGEVVRKNDVWSKDLKPYTQYNSSSSGIIQTEMFMLSDQIEGLVQKHADVKITLKGQLVKTNGERVAFEASEFFKAESRSGVTTYWEVLAGC